jgi:hypothetical protein
MLTVHLRVNDADSKRPTPVRLAVTGPGGEYYPPLGRFAAFPCGVGEDVGGNLRVGRDNFAVIDGACEIQLPAGVPLRIRAAKGPEFRPLDETVALGAGQLAVRLEIARWINFADRGWMSGDSRVHFVPPHAALMEGAAEDVAVVNLLAKVELQLAKDGNTYPTVQHLTAFSGQAPALAAGGHAVVVNTYNAHRALGSLGLLNAHRVVFPLAFGDPLDTDDWSLSDWAAQCRRKKGLVVWARAFHADAGGEGLAAAVLGKIDAIEFDAEVRPSPLLPWYYRLLNAGVRLPLVGGSGKDSNRVPVGAVRTYAQVGGDRTYAAWVEAVRAGRTFVTNGPLLTFDVSAKAAATAECVTRFEKLEVVADGQPVAAAKPVEEAGRFVARIETALPAANWVAARCVGKPSPLNPAAINFAHTSPVHLGPPRRDPTAAAALAACLGQLREWATTAGRYRDENWRAQLLGRCDEAAAKLVPETEG